VLLRSVDYGEADRIVTLLTERHGRVSVLARSARKSTKRFAGALEPFGLLEAEIAMGNAEVGGLSSARLVRGFPSILGSLPAMTIAGRALEVVRAATPPRESDPELLGAVLELFEALSIAPRESTRVAFVIRYLSLLGLAPQLDACGKCGKRPSKGQSSSFDPANGSIVCRACGGGPIVLRAATRERMSAATTRAWASELDPWTDLETRSADDLLGAFMERHLSGGRVTGGKKR
jgi:DNA repair protein RecO (recombination protein O)